VIQWKRIIFVSRNDFINDRFLTKHVKHKQTVNKLQLIATAHLYTQYLDHHVPNAEGGGIPMGPERREKS
jgi:hypothetical protein